MSQLSNNNPIENNTSGKPELCRMCCEFFGNQYTDNLCSACFKKNNKTGTTPEKTVAPLTTAEVLKTVESVVSAPIEEQKTVEAEPVAVKMEAESQETSKKVQTDPKKCFVCPKKTGALAYQCKCGFTYCKSHRLPEDHDCDFDFRQEAAKKLAKENPIVVASKLAKI